MTYEERQRYQELRERIAALRSALQEEDSDGPVTRAELLDLLDIVEAAVERMSPERWDRALEAIAGEAARRADALAARRG
ncbi:MAG: hypothetical protein ACE5JR_01805 [Gemmatimonadota bacterium]